MSTLVLMRHGESLWNLENRFTGSNDVPLTEKGRADAVNAALKCPGQKFDVAYSSTLSRAKETAVLFLKALESDAPLIAEPALIEKSYGILEGLSKTRVKAEYGEDIYNLWHRSYEVGPPGGESLYDLTLRVYPFVRRVVGEDLRLGKNVLLVAHGNVIRSLIMLVEKLDRKEVARVEVGTAVPLIYHLDEKFTVLDR
ncbi:MAG: 2,3-bisphosphoglycerate-dependent phosphoglycerate mutase [Deltaproteobacteria bacterium]|nr:2,3-bisphosphoglycerate-dependent phosphoglycerate mutase [Deltaproteobacteria bacterium]